MSLPKIITPEYTVQLMSVKTPVRFRPYLVKEEKIFLTAKQSGDIDEINRAIFQIIRNCTFDALNVEALPPFDIEYLFLQLRARSVNNIAELNYECRNFVRDTSETDGDDRRCHQIVKIPVNLDDVKLATPDEHTPVITLNTGLIVEMKYPTVSVLEQFRATNDINIWVPLIASCISMIIEPDGNIYEVADYPIEELVEFVENIGVLDLQKFEQFFETMPVLTHNLLFECPKCGHTETIVLKGLDTFFM